MSKKENNKETQHQDGSAEIVKRIENPRSEAEEHYTEDIHTPQHTKTHETHDNSNHENVDHEYYNNDNEIYKDYKKKNKPAKKGILTLVTLTTVGVVGYFGLNALDKKSTNETTSNQTTQTASIGNIDEVNKTTTKKETFYVEALAVKTKDNEPTAEPIVVSTVSKPKENETPTEIKIEKAPIESIKAPLMAEAKIEETPKQEEKIALIESVVKEEIPVPKKEVQEEPKEVAKVESVERVVKKKSKRIKYEKIKLRITTVRKGDSLASISERFYGNPMEFKRIIRANSRIRSRRTSLRLGEKIIVPRKDNKTTRRYILVERGNTLASIAKSVYGTTDKISKIVRANYKIKSKRSTLRLGQKVYVPR